MTHRKKLIEVALPLEAINKASAREKSIRHGHPSTLHLWWARRPLAACRAVIFSSLVDDPNDPDAPPEFVEACHKLPRGRNAADNDTPRQRLFDFIETLVLWESTTDEQILETARRLIRLATNDNPPPLLDPFAGGGSIPLEAQRLGLEAHASDLNPVAVMINKALIEIPPKFANMPPVNPRDREKMGSGTRWKGAAGLAADVRYYGEWIRDRAWEQIGHLYPDCNGETVLAWIWARAVRSPNPAIGAEVPLVRSFDLSRKKGYRHWVEPRVDRANAQIEYLVRSGIGKAPNGTISRRGGKCIISNTPITLDYIQSEAQSGRMKAHLMAVVTEGLRSRNYYAPDRVHIETPQLARPLWRPDFEMSTHPQYMAPPRYGMTSYADIFSPRQLHALNVFADLIGGELREHLLRDCADAGLELDDYTLASGGKKATAYADAVMTYLALALDRVVMGCNTLTRWNSVGQKAQHCFGRQALPIVWDYAETNPFTESTGSWASGVKYVADPLEMGGVHPYVEASVSQRDATDAFEVASLLISTDPPYYDNVPYADLSDFFHIWLRRILKGIFPGVFGTMLVPKTTELVADHQRFGGRDAANQHFEAGLRRSFEHMRKAMNESFPLTVYYAFKQADIQYQAKSEATSVGSTGWETMLQGLNDAGFLINGTWPIRTEMRTRLRSFDSNALASSIVLVCRPRAIDAPMTSRRDFVNALRRELPAALREMQSGNIAPVDLAQASIGPGMAVYSRYSKVLEPNGDRLTVRTALQLINHELDAYLAEQEGYIDEDSRFAVAWFEQFGFKEGPFGQADVLARAKNTSVDGLDYAGVLRSGAGKVQLLHWSELDAAWDPTADKRLTVWEAVHHLAERLNVHGEEGAAMLLAKMPSDLAAQARQLAYRLYSICERKGWAEHARDYNALVISWSASQEQAREFKEQYQQGTLF